MDIPALAKTLLDAGGWAAFLVLVIAAGFGFVRGVIVPGRYFDREAARADKAETIATRNAEAIEQLTVELRTRRRA